MVVIAASVPISELLSFGDNGYGDELFWATLRTLGISILGYALGLALGLIGAVGKISGPKWLGQALSAYTTLFRALPELILIMLLYYAGTDGVNRLLADFGFGAVQISGMAAAVLVLGIVQGAYSTEVLRAAINAVPIGQLEAASALGMSSGLRFRRITLPAMLPHAIPGLSNLWLNITKESALISVVGFTELALATQQAAGVSKRYFALYVVAQCIYLAISMASGWGFSAFERRLRLGERPSMGAV